MSLELDITTVMYFLDKLDPEGRHTIASEAPFGNNGMPKWERGCTYERDQRDYLIQDIIERQRRCSNVYYSVNRPCRVSDRQGANGKNNIDDIISIRALAFDIDTLELENTVLQTITKNLVGELKPSMVISTGGGYHLIYFLEKREIINLYRPATNKEEEEINERVIQNRSAVTLLARDSEHMLRDKFPNWKIDNMSNVDRVMRLPGTVNYPETEKIRKGQKPALSHIALETGQKIDIHKLREMIPYHTVTRANKRPYGPPKGIWTGHLKARFCCEYIRELGLADTNEWYTINVMLPLIGAIHDPDKYNSVTLEEAEELFMLAISGGERYGTIGRGPGYFKRQWKSHRPEIAREGNKSLGGLIWACKQAGFKIPWIPEIIHYEDHHKKIDVTDELLNELLNTLNEYIVKITEPEQVRIAPPQIQTS